jgi:spoIIIJ-associated protein
VNDRKYSLASVGPRIEQFLRPLVQQAGFRLNYEVVDGQPAAGDFETPDVVVRFSGPDVDLLLANRAELLLALEHVTMEALRMPSEDHSRISFDANDYRLLRIEELRLSASAAAEKVKRTGVPFRFNPMNSRERRVIHLALRNETEVRSESSGSGGFRQVVVYPAGMASLPEPPQPAFTRREPQARRDSPRDRDRGRGRPQSRGARR